MPNRSTDLHCPTCILRCQRENLRFLESSQRKILDRILSAMSRLMHDAIVLQLLLSCFVESCTTRSTPNRTDRHSWLLDHEGLRLRCPCSYCASSTLSLEERDSCEDARCVSRAQAIRRALKSRRRLRPKITRAYSMSMLNELQLRRLLTL